MKTKTVDDIKDLGTILSVWAHPDDESFACGGLMSQAVANGQTVVCLTATKGEKGIQDESRWPSERLGQIRAEELDEALSILGITEHYWLDYPDGGCKLVNSEEAIMRIAQHIRHYQPDTILTFGPEGMTGHPDHCCVSTWVDAAANQADSKANVYHAVELRENYEAMKAADEKYNFFYNIDQPPLKNEGECDILIKLPDELLIKKYQALASMPSQYEAMLRDFGQDVICSMICNEAFTKSKGTD